MGQLPLSENLSFRFYIRNALFIFALSLLLPSCQPDELQSTTSEKTKIARVDATILDEITHFGQFDNVTVKVRSHGSGYHARARCTGFIPAGEYEGFRFVVTIEGEYSGLGLETLVAGSARVRIRDEQFNSVTSMELQSFCCGEGHIQDFGTHYEFVVHGQVEHPTPTPHNHLFAGLGSTLGLMNFNVSDQTGTTTEPEPGGPPPHDPGIGLIIDIPAHPVTVDEVP